ncbi:MAG: M20/M25/M40 family metallo-hydrolase [Anaerolineales bacterium]|nr:M20/M25/M40 family metallo-hydrolase [Anaerolineales bacterium]
MDTFYAHLDANRDRFLDELKRYCAQPSVAAQNLGMTEMAELVKERLEARGFSVRLIPTAGHPVVYGELGEGPRTLLIYDHYDVQPPEPLELWDSPPFTPTIRDGKLFARGAADNKGDQLCRMQAIEAWLATQGPLPLKIKWVIEGEEEIGSPNLEAFAHEHAEMLRADGCLWEFGGKNEHEQFTLTLGVKGIAYFELRLKEMEVDAHSAYAAFLPNAPWRLLWALSSLRAPDGRITLDDYWPHVAPPSAEDLALVDVLPFDAEKIKANFGVREWLFGMDDRTANRALRFAPTLTICGLEAGYTGAGTKTVLPKEARAKLDFRLVPNLTPDLVYDLLRRHLDRRGFDDIEIVRLSAEHAARTSPSAEIVQAALRAARTVYGHEPVLDPTSGGSGPMYSLCDRLSIPAVSAGVGYPGSRAHAPNEHIRLDDYWQCQRFIGHLIREFARQDF